MTMVKISSKMDRDAWAELKQLAAETNQSIAGVLTEAARDYIRRRRLRPDVLRHLETSMEDNEVLARKLAGTVNREL